MRGGKAKAVDLAFSRTAYDARHSRYLRRFGGQDPAKYIDAVCGILQADVNPHLAHLTMKTLIVCGRNDALMPAEEGAKPA